MGCSRWLLLFFVFSSRRRHTRCALVTGVQTCALPILIGRPEILVADEPTGNVDPDMAERLLHLFDSLNRLGTTLVVATHDLHLISRISGAKMMRLDKIGRAHV